MIKKLMIGLISLGLGGCTLLSIPVAVVDTAAGIVKLPITAVDSVIDAVNDDDEDGDE